MCANFLPAPKSAITLDLGWPEPTFDFRGETYVGYQAPIRLIPPDSGIPDWREGRFGLVPFWAKDTKISRQTFNARSETVASKPSYRDPWKKRRYALVPMMGFFEPDYATGKPIRWRIERRDHQAFTAAAIWDYWRDPAGDGMHSFSLLTLNADGHPVMGRFHAPGDEKRSIVIVAPENRDAWLQATPDEAAALIQPMLAEAFTANPLLARRLREYRQQRRGEGLKLLKPLMPVGLVSWLDQILVKPSGALPGRTSIRLSTRLSQALSREIVDSGG